MRKKEIKFLSKKIVINELNPLFLFNNNFKLQGPVLLMLVSTIYKHLHCIPSRVIKECSLLFIWNNKRTKCE